MLPKAKHSLLVHSSIMPPIGQECMHIKYTSNIFFFGKVTTTLIILTMGCC